jgi:multidrug efflux pump subunit AcrB
MAWMTARSCKSISTNARRRRLGVSIDDINNTLSTAWGSTYVNDFVDRGRVKKVYVQAAAPFRMLPGDIDKWYVRNSAGGMVPFTAFATSHWEYGSPRLERYNGNSALEIVGEAAEGVSSGTAMAEMEKIVSQLPTGFGLEWTAMSYQERLSGSQAPALYAISLLVVFLCLAALYESWSIPFSVMLVVPLGLIGAVAATWLRGLENDVYFQVGMLTIIGLSAKNAILIVEFANELNQKGQDLMSATLGSLAHAPAADFDDLAGLYLRRTADDHQQRRRLRQPTCGGHRGDGRHDFRYPAGDLLRAIILRAGTPPFPRQAAYTLNNWSCIEAATQRIPRSLH